jgi:hypothetical protein
LTSSPCVQRAFKQVAAVAAVAAAEAIKNIPVRRAPPRIAAAL